MTSIEKSQKKPLLFFNEEKLKTKRVLYASELQKLVGLVLLPQHYTSWPDWCVVRKPLLVRSVLLLFCDGLNTFTSEDPEFSTYFGKPFCFYTPEAYAYSWDAEIRLVPRMSLSKHAIQMSESHQSILLPAPKRKWLPTSDEATAAKQRRLTEITKEICAPESNNDSERHTKQSPKPRLDLQCPFPMPDPGAADKFDRTQLLMSLEQMVYERIPLPPEIDRQAKRTDVDGTYVPSKSSYLPVSSSSPMFAVDCEMVMTKFGQELARVTMVDELNCVVFDRLVRPDNPIEDYVTRFSGITRDMLAPVTTRVADIQQELNELLPPDAILVGHSIGNDLHAMKIYHPYLIDTSVIYNLKGARCSKARLRFLAEHFLGRMIQTGRAGHSSAEDAIATMDLVRLKLSQSLAFGDVNTAWRFPEDYNERRFKNHSKKKDTNSVAKDAAPPSSSAPELSSFVKLKTTGIHTQFQLKVADLQTSYNTFGPPIDLTGRLLNDAGIRYVCWPAPSGVNSGQSDATADDGEVPQINGATNLMSKKLVAWLVDLAQSNRFIMARAECAEQWDETKRRRKFERFSQKLYRALPVHSLLVLVCAGSPSEQTDLPQSAKRTVYITLTSSDVSPQNEPPRV